jgi:hypothetical protein
MYLKWLVYLPINIFANLIAILLSPILALPCFIEIRNGREWLIPQLSWFQTIDALMLYAGFANTFKSLAQTFAQWEASVWVEASAYKAEVLAGNKPMPTPEEAVLMMPLLAF